MAMQQKSSESNKHKQWKIELADAILEEASFSGCPIREGSPIEHQLGTVWVGRVTISPQPAEQDTP